MPNPTATHVAVECTLCGALGTMHAARCGRTACRTFGDAERVHAQRHVPCSVHARRHMPCFVPARSRGSNGAASTEPVGAVDCAACTEAVYVYHLMYMPSVVASAEMDDAPVRTTMQPDENHATQCFSLCSLE